LNLSGCHHLTDEGFQQLAFGCRQLQWLAIMFCTELSDMSVQYVAGGCSELATLHLHGIPKLTNSALQTCLARCRQLRVLSVFSASGITRERVRSASGSTEFRLARCSAGSWTHNLTDLPHPRLQVLIARATRPDLILYYDTDMPPDSPERTFYEPAFTSGLPG
jgi:hypothetical protein